MPSGNASDLEPAGLGPEAKPLATALRTRLRSFAVSLWPPGKSPYREANNVMGLLALLSCALTACLAVIGLFWNLHGDRSCTDIIITDNGTKVAEWCIGPARLAHIGCANITHGLCWEMVRAAVPAGCKLPRY